MRNQSASDVQFEALGDSMRRRIIEQLQGGALPVGRLAATLPVGRPAVSKHLRVLEDAGLVEHRSRGTSNLYALAPGGLADVKRWLDDVWANALPAFAQFVETETAEPARPAGETARRKP